MMVRLATMMFVLAMRTIALWCATWASGQPLLLQPLPNYESPDSSQVALGKKLFFDKRLSGDATISCATCHDPSQTFTDGLELSKGYPGTLYFRNTPTIINSRYLFTYYWDRRMSGDDMPSMIRDHISEAHFMQADGRLVIERLRQVPEYEAEFQRAFGGEPSYGKILNALAAFVRSIVSVDAPLDRYLRGDPDAMSASAQRGMDLFRSKANCVACHRGPMLTDDYEHNTGVATNQKVFQEPERHITFRRFFRTLGISDYASLRFDIGCACISKKAEDRGKFRTPSLREVAKTAPYMHNGSIATLEEVVDFYDAGGGEDGNKSELLKPLNLTDQEKADLLSFLESLSGTQGPVAPVKSPSYELRKLGEQ